MVLALGEAIANAAEHAYPDDAPGPLDARFSHEPDGEVLMLVSDAGRWLRADDAERSHRGHGLALMRAVMDRVDVVPSSTGTRVELRYRPRPSPSEAAAGMAQAATPDESSGLEVESDGTGTVHVRVRGEIDGPAAASLADAVLPRLAPGRPLVIDLSRSAYMGSAAVHAIGDAMRRAGAAGADLSVRVAAGSAPHRVLVLTGLADGLGVSIVAPQAPGARPADPGAEGSDVDADPTQQRA
jgi:anti-anti-sigma factor